MTNSIRLIETYVPGLQPLSEARREVLRARLIEAVGRHGLRAAIVFIPQDEVVLVLAWSARSTAGDRLPDVDRAAARQLIDGSHVDAIVQRVVDAYLFIPYDDREA